MGAGFANTTTAVSGAGGLDIQNQIDSSVENVSEAKSNQQL